MIMDMKAILASLVRSPEGRLNVSGCTNRDMDRSIKVKLVVEQIVVITDRRSTADDEGYVLGDAGIKRGNVTLNRISSVELEEADTTGVDMCRLAGVVRVIEVGGICWAVKAADKLEAQLADSVFAVEVGSRCLERVVCRSIVG